MNYGNVDLVDLYIDDCFWIQDFVNLVLNFLITHVLPSPHGLVVGELRFELVLKYFLKRVHRIVNQFRLIFIRNSDKFPVFLAGYVDYVFQSHQMLMSLLRHDEDLFVVANVLRVYFNLLVSVPLGGVQVDRYVFAFVRLVPGKAVVLLWS